jgi:clan AA aspartic protease (TIGR02281 family)
VSFAVIIVSSTAYAACDVRPVAIFPSHEGKNFVINFSYTHDWQGCDLHVVCRVEDSGGVVLVSGSALVEDSFQSVSLEVDKEISASGRLKVNCSFRDIATSDLVAWIKAPADKPVDNRVFSSADDHGGTASKRAKTVIRNRNGSYFVVGKINNRNVPCVIDTGASYVTINRKEARKLHVRYEGKRITLLTASGMEKAWPARILKMTIGNITVTNVKAVVTRGHYPPVVLVGMSFLEHVNMVHDGDSLVLEKR